MYLYGVEQHVYRVSIDESTIVTRNHPNVNVLCTCSLVAHAVEDERVLIVGATHLLRRIGAQLQTEGALRNSSLSFSHPSAVAEPEGVHAARVVADRQLEKVCLLWVPVIGRDSIDSALIIVRSTRIHKIAAAILYELSGCRRCVKPMTYLI